MFGEFGDTSRSLQMMIFFILTIRLTWESIDSVRRKRFDHFNVHIMIRQFSIFWLKYSVYWLFFTRIYFITDNLRNFKNILRINPRLRFWKEDNFECWKFANIIQLYFQCRCRFSLSEPYNGAKNKSSKLPVCHDMPWVPVTFNNYSPIIHRHWGE